MTNKFRNNLLFFILLFAISSTQAVYCAKAPKIKLQTMQNRIFNSNDKEKVWNAVITTLYDNDFIIEDIDKDLGHIRAIKTFKSHYVNKKRIAGWSTALVFASAYTVFSYGSGAYSMYSPTKRIANEMRDKTIVVDTNVNIEKLSEDKINIKFVLAKKILQNADGFSFNTMTPVRVIRIYEPYVYNEFFNQVEKNIETFTQL